MVLRIVWTVPVIAATLVSLAAPFPLPSLCVLCSLMSPKLCKREIASIAKPRVSTEGSKGVKIKYKNASSPHATRMKPRERTKLKIA